MQIDLILVLLFINIINDMHKKVWGIFIKFSSHTKLGVIANILESRNKIQNILDRLEKWPENNMTTANKCNVRHAFSPAESDETTILLAISKT